MNRLLRYGNWVDVYRKEMDGIKGKENLGLYGNIRGDLSIRNVFGGRRRGKEEEGGKEGEGKMKDLGGERVREGNVGRIEMHYNGNGNGN